MSATWWNVRAVGVRLWASSKITASPRVSVGVDGLLHGHVLGGQMQRHHPGVVGRAQPVLADRLGGDAAQLPAEEPLEVLLPLRDQVRRGHHQHPLGQAEPLRLPQPHPGHDRLAGAGLVCQQEPQHRLGQHRPVHRQRLVRVGPQRSGGQRRRLGRRHRMAHPLVPQPGEHLPGIGPAVGLKHLELGGFVGGQRHPGDVFGRRLGRDVERATAVAGGQHILDHQDVGPVRQPDPLALSQPRRVENGHGPDANRRLRQRSEFPLPSAAPPTAAWSRSNMGWD